MNIINLFSLIFLTISIDAEKISYQGFKLYKVKPKTVNQVHVLETIKDTGLGEVWNEYFKVNDDLKVLVSPEQQQQFLARLRQANIEVNTIIENVERAIDDQLEFKEVSRNSTFHSLDWENYYSLEHIEKWLDELIRAYPNIVSSVTMGRSVENREIKGIKINYNANRVKPLAMLEGTLHAREWISTATVTWIIKEFLTSSDPNVRFMAENLEWHIFPVVNPDGYVYTFTNNRMWRKNRSRTNFTTCAASGQLDDMSNGVDLNRNFDFFWMTVGASDNPCSNLFAGPAPGSEPETRAISQYVLDLKKRGDIVYYLSFHSYTQLFILPYSHVSSIEEMVTENHDDLYEIARNSSQKLSERYGTSYRVGISAEVLYPMGGSSFDWVKYYGNASVSYLIELRDMGEYGFLLPRSQIIPNNLEIMDAMIEMDKTTRRLGYYSHAASYSISWSILMFSVLFINLFN